MNNPVRSNRTSRFHIRVCGLAALAVFTLAGCTMMARADPYASAVGMATQAAAAQQRGDYASASRDYEEAARTSPQQDAPNYLMSAAETALKANDPVRASMLLDGIQSGVLDRGQMARLRTDRAALTSARNPALPLAASSSLGSAAPPVPSALPAPLPGTAGAGAVALLLPLSGPFASTADAIRDGFMTAYLRSGGHVPVRVYDAGTGNDTAMAAYQQALRDGAGFIVGPLRKEAVSAVAAQAQLSVPVLALNYLDDNARTPANFYQFGLAPEDEARAAAERAVTDGDRHAVALVPQSEWGDRVLAAFSQRLAQLGGGVLKSARYSAGATDFSKPIQDIFNLDASKERHRALTAILGEKSEFEPRRRNDVDFIFFAARPSDARLLWPQLRFFRASDLPAYATSLVYDGTQEVELNGVRFCDMPWILQGDGGYATQRIEAGELASARAQPRLFALGMDAWRLAALIQSGQGMVNTVYPSASGGLVIGANHVVARKLECARIQNGNPVLLPAGLSAAGQ
ncbi:MAG: penicillin-binding protein activator [Stenotrophobium sp.]